MTDNLAELAGWIGLQIRDEKNKMMKSTGPVRSGLQLEVKTVEEVDHFIYLGSCIENEGT